MHKLLSKQNHQNRIEMREGMKDIKKQIRKISIKKSIYSFVVLLLAGFVFYKIPFYDVLKPTTIEEPLGVEKLYEDGNTYIEMTADTLYYTGYDYTENGKVLGSYYYNLYEGTCIFYLLTPAQSKQKAEEVSNVYIKAKLQSGGKLLTELIKRMAEDLSWTAQGLSAVSSHILINGVEYLILKTVFLMGVTILLLIVSMLIFINWLVYIINPLAYPACLKLRKYGSVKKQIQKAEQELNENVILKKGDFYITEHYFIEWSKNQITVLPLDKMVWAYKHSSFHYLRIYKGKLTYTFRIIGKKSIRFVSPFHPKESVDAILECLKEKQPHILIGYTRKNESLAKKNGYRR